jgi:hypothetical protein
MNINRSSWWWASENVGYTKNFRILDLRTRNTTTKFGYTSQITSVNAQLDCIIEPRSQLQGIIRFHLHLCNVRKKIYFPLALWNLSICRNKSKTVRRTSLMCMRLASTNLRWIILLFTHLQYTNTSVVPLLLFSAYHIQEWHLEASVNNFFSEIASFILEAITSMCWNRTEDTVNIQCELFSRYNWLFTILK